MLQLKQTVQALEANIPESVTVPLRDLQPFIFFLNLSLFICTATASFLRVPLQQNSSKDDYILATSNSFPSYFLWTPLHINFHPHLSLKQSQAPSELHVSDPDDCSQASSYLTSPAPLSSAPPLVFSAQTWCLLLFLF